MNIAMVVPPWIKVPPKKYGGIEVVVGLLADGLVDRKHQVTLFTVSKTSTKARVFKTFDEKMRPYLDKSPPDFLTVALTHTLRSYMRIARGDFDIIHDHTWKEGICCALFTKIPFVHTLHGRFDKMNRRFYSLFKGDPRVHFVAISNFQRASFPGLNYAATIYNAIDVRKYPYSKEKEDFFFYLGRFNPQKAPHLACKVAERLGEKLILAGKVSEKEECRYFDKNVKPHLSDKIRFLGEVSQKEKAELFSKAKGFLFPLQWDEPFGITTIEAQACGTPVVTFRRGAAPELVEHGVTGYVVETMDGFVEAARRIDEIDPKKCRERAKRMFRPEVMVDGYERIYEKILSSRSED